MDSRSSDSDGLGHDRRSRSLGKSSDDNVEEADKLLRHKKSGHHRRNHDKHKHHHSDDEKNHHLHRKDEDHSHQHAEENNGNHAGQADTMVV